MTDNRKLAERLRAILDQFDNAIDGLDNCDELFDDMRKIADELDAAPERNVTSEDQRLADATVKMLLQDWTSRKSLTHHQGDLIVRALQAYGLSQQRIKKALAKKGKRK